MKLLSFLLLLFFVLPVYSQTATISPLVLTHISEENGLSDNHVTCIYKDKQELLWVGTKDGLNLLDGSTIRFFRNDPADSNSICNNYISGITEDKFGKIWIGTANGLCSYDKVSRKFSGIQYHSDSKVSIGGISNIATDPEHSLWFGSGGGLFQYDLLSKKLSEYYNSSTEFETDTRSSNRISHVIFSSDNKVWLSTADGLWNFSPVTHKFVKMIHKQNDPFYHPLCLTVYEDHEKNIWAGFWNTGLRKIETHTGKIIDYGTKLDHLYTVTAISEVQQPDGKNILWLNGKLFAFDESTGNYFKLRSPILEKDFQMLLLFFGLLMVGYG